MLKKIKLNGEFTKKQLQEKIKEFDKRSIKLITRKSGKYNYWIDLLVHDIYITNLYLDKENSYSLKICEINKLIYTAIKEYGGEDNLANQEEMNDDYFPTYGFTIYEIIEEDWFQLPAHCKTTSKYMNNCFSKDHKIVEEVFEVFQENKEFFKAILKRRDYETD